RPPDKETPPSRAPDARTSRCITPGSHGRGAATGYVSLLREVRRQDFDGAAAVGVTVGVGGFAGAWVVTTRFTVGAVGAGVVAGAVVGSGSAGAGTVPLIFALAFLPMVPLALRVASRLTTACCTVAADGVARGFGWKPKSASSGLSFPNR